MLKISTFLSSAMNGELDEERRAIRILFKTSAELLKFYELYAIEEHASPSGIDADFSEHVRDSQVLISILKWELRKPVQKEFETARTNGLRIFCYIAEDDSRQKTICLILSETARTRYIAVPIYRR